MAINFLKNHIKFTSAFSVIYQSLNSICLLERNMDLIEKSSVKEALSINHYNFINTQIPPPNSTS
jgi:hypothetical protein